MTAIAIQPKELGKWKKPTIAVDTLLAEKPALMRDFCVGVDVGYHHFVCLSTGEKVRRGEPRALARRLAKEYEVICTEARSPMLADFTPFFDALDLFCLQHNSQHVTVDRYFPSTRLCSVCQKTHPPIALNIRAWKCSFCGALHDRDINAAKNIREKGLEQLRVKSIFTSAARLGPTIYQVTKTPVGAAEVS